MRKISFLISALIFLSAQKGVEAKEFAIFDIVGDSISKGINPQTTENYGWADMLFGITQAGIPPPTNTIYDLWPDIVCYNSAISGSTAIEWSSDYLGRLSAVKSHHPDLIVVCIGGNDLFGSINTLQDIETYRTNLTSIVTNLQQNTPVPDLILVTYYDPFDGFSTNLTGSLSNRTKVSSITLAANQVIRDVAKNTDCYLIEDTRTAFLHHGYGGDIVGGEQHLTPDFFQLPLADFDVHPVTDGYMKLHELVYSKLIYLKKYGVPENWMTQYGFTNYLLNAPQDPDKDGLPTWKEYVAGTDPTNRASVFSMSVNITTQETVIIWEPVSNRTYSLQWFTNLIQSVPTLQTNLSDSPFTNSAHSVEQNIFYRMDVRLD